MALWAIAIIIGAIITVSIIGIAIMNNVANL